MVNSNASSALSCPIQGRFVLAMNNLAPSVLSFRIEDVSNCPRPAPLLSSVVVASFSPCPCHGPSTSLVLTSRGHAWQAVVIETSPLDWTKGDEDVKSAGKSKFVHSFSRVQVCTEHVIEFFDVASTGPPLIVVPLIM